MALLTYHAQVTTHHLILPEEMNRLRKAGGFTVVEDRPQGVHGMRVRVVRMPDDTLWRGHWDGEYLTFERVEEVQTVQTTYKTFNRKE